ncbi:hypothetical protein GCM10010429_22700 [Micromonospora olivasterospora]
MPEHLHGDSRVDVEVGQERGAGTPGVVDGDPLDACSFAPGLPGALKVARFDGCAIAVCSTSARVTPGTDTSTHRDPGGCGGTAGYRPVWEDFLYVYEPRRTPGGWRGER